MSRVALSQIHNFFVMETDGAVVACASLQEIDNKKQLGEIAAFAVHPKFRNGGRGDQLLHLLENQAIKRGYTELFLLTTRTAEWFVQRGFEFSNFSVLPRHRLSRVDPRRNSKLFVKLLQRDESEKEYSLNRSITV